MASPQDINYALKVNMLKNTEIAMSTLQWMDKIIESDPEGKNSS